MHLIKKRFPADLQFLRGLGPAPLAFFQSPENAQTFGLFRQRTDIFFQSGGLVVPGSPGFKLPAQKSEILDSNRRSRRIKHRPLNNIFELTDISLPFAACQDAECGGRNSPHIFFEGATVLCQDVIDVGRNIFRMVPERRYREFQNIQPVE